jgi:glycosyltransferase involved in cell wall biosynthesis
MKDRLSILQISPRLPWPPDFGGAIGIYNITKFLAQRGHDITFVCFGRAGSDSGDLARYCELHVIDHDLRNSVTGAVINLAERLPYTVRKYRHAGMEETLRALCRRKRFDVVHVDHAHIAPLGEMLQREFGLPYVLREHNYEALIHERFARSHRLPLLSQWLRMQAARWERYEAEVLCAPDVIAAITPEDKAMIQRHSDAEVHIVPAGVDALAMQPFDSSEADEAHVVLLGSLAWLPNRDAAQWFLDEVWPLLRTAHPRIRCTIAGAQPPRGMIQRGDDRVRIAGHVDDLADLLRSATVLAVPLRIGGGMRIKLLEFFAYGKAVVSTRIGAEGNHARHAEELLLADDAKDFANAVLRVIGDHALRSRLGAAARALVLSRYTWQHIAGLFEQSYFEAMRRRHANSSPPSMC